MFLLNELYSMLTARTAIRYESAKLLELLTLPTVLTLWIAFVNKHKKDLHPEQ
jgi:hypothetical protein